MAPQATTAIATERPQARGGKHPSPTQGWGLSQERLAEIAEFRRIRDGQAARTWQPWTSISPWKAPYRAYWCGNFSCSDEELATAVRIMDSTAVGHIGLYPRPLSKGWGVHRVIRENAPTDQRQDVVRISNTRRTCQSRSLDV